MKRFFKKFIFVSAFVISFLFTFDIFAQTDGTLTFSVTTSTAPVTGDPGNYYAPKHVLAIWIADENGNWVKTRKLRAATRKAYLYTFKSKCPTYNVVDAVSAATLSSHTSHTVTWDCKDVNGNIVPDGIYMVYVEFTEEHMQGPLYYLSFTKGPNAQHLTPANQSYFKNITLDWISTAGINDNENDLYGSIYCYPNPFVNNTTLFINNVKHEAVDILMYDIKGNIVKKIYNNAITKSEERLYLDFSNEKLPAGIYFLKIKLGNQQSIMRIVKTAS